MTTFRICTIPSEPTPRPRVDAVQLCLVDHWLSEEDLPALTQPCGSKEEVEAEFERVIAAIKQKKEEALELLAEDERRRKQAPNQSSQPTPLTRRG